jgi:hypothetical protein
MSILTTVATMLVASVSQASFVIDDFMTGTGVMSRGNGAANGVNSVANQTITPNSINRSVTLSGVKSNNGGQPNIKGQIGGGVLGYSFQTVNPNAPSLGLTYDGFGMNVLNVQGATINTSLQYNHNTLPQNFDVTVSGTSLFAPGTFSSVVSVTNLGPTVQAFSFDTSLWGLSSKALRNVTSLSFLITRVGGTTQNNSNVQFKALGGISTTGNLVPVPEPASLVLMGLTCLGGVVYRRRRSSAVAV